MMKEGSRGVEGGGRRKMTPAGSAARTSVARERSKESGRRGTTGKEEAREETSVSGVTSTPGPEAEVVVGPKELFLNP